MSEQGWQIAIKAAVARDVADTPARHSLWTPQCPEVPRFTANQLNWSDEEKAHIVGCAYCQKMLAFRERLLAEEAAVLPNPVTQQPPASPAVAPGGELLGRPTS